MIPIIGHRGWRGKYPENSLKGFEKLALSGVNAVELDVVVTKDNQLLVSHEPWFDAQYCLSKFSQNIYQLTTDQIQKTDCGSKLDSRFPNQENTFSYKPTFLELVELWRRLDVKPKIALEVKSEPKLYGIFQPFASQFADLLLDFEQKYLKGFDYFVQSFDPLFLKTYHRKSPKSSTGLLVEGNIDFDKEIDFLDYKPDYYNPEHILLTDKLVNKVTKENIGIYTWTVNTIDAYNKIKDYPLQGVISDYPEIFTK